MKKFTWLLIFVFFPIIFFAKDAAAWTSYRALGFQKLQAQANISYRFDQHGGFWSEGRLVYGVSEQADIFAQLGFVRPVESGHGTLGYGLGVKWTFSTPAEILPGLSFTANYRAARPGTKIFNWVDLILQTGYIFDSWEAYILLGMTIPKDDEASTFLGFGMIVPFAEMPQTSFSLGLCYNANTPKQEAYFTFDSGINYLF